MKIDSVQKKFAGRSIRFKAFFFVFLVAIISLLLQAVFLENLVKKHLINMALKEKVTFYLENAKYLLSQDGTANPVSEHDNTKMKQMFGTDQSLSASIVIDAFGKIITSTGQLTLTPEQQDILSGAREHKMIRVDNQGRWGIAIPVFEEGKYRGSLVGILSMKDFDNDLETIKRTVIAVSAGTWFILIVSLLVVLDYMVLKRVKNLSRVSAALAQGDYIMRAPEEPNDEIGAMAKHFNHMTDSLITAVTAQESEKLRLKAIVDTQNEYLFTVDTQRRITMVNRRMAGLFGLPPEAIIGTKCFSLINSSSCRGGCAFDTNDRGFEIVRDVEASIELSDGRIVPIRKNAQIIQDENGQVVGAVETFRDISGEKELARLKAEWESFIRHEIKSPLNPIIGFSALLLETKTDIDAETREYLEIIYNSAQNLNRILNMTKEVRQYESGNIDLLLIQADLRDTMEEALREAAETLKAREPNREYNSRLTILPGVETMIEHDPDKMQRVFMNLVKNAWEHHDGLVSIGFYNDGSFINVAIHNDGEPIPADRLGNIFEKYNTTKQGRGGTGLGTTIALLFARAHGGDIRVTSTHENGTEFTVRLPRYRPGPSTGNISTGMNI